MRSLYFIEIGMGPTLNEQLRTYVVLHFKSQLKRSHVLRVIDFQIRPSIYQKLKAFVMLAENCNGYSCQALICLLIYRETVLREKHLHNIRVILVNSKVQSIHTMLRCIQQIYLLGSQQNHDGSETLLSCDPKGINSFEILCIYIQFGISQQLCDHVFTFIKVSMNDVKMEKNAMMKLRKIQVYTYCPIYDA